ncbi:MAG: beta strand repeat-containing protein [Thermoanaerobaculales bacterium]
MKRNHILVALAVAAILVGASCNTKSPTAPAPSPTPSTYSVGLVASASQIEVGHAIVITATVNGSGGQKAPDGTSVTFKLLGCVPTGATDPALDNGGCSEVRTTSAGVAAASVFASAVTGTFEVDAIVSNAQASVNVRFFNPINPRALAIYGIVPNQGIYTGGETVTIQGRGFLKPVTVDFVVSGTIRHADVTAVAGDGSSVTVTTPNTQFIPGASSVPADVVVTAAAGTSNQTTDTLKSGFTFLFQPSSGFGTPLIYSIVPSQGLVTGGDTVTIYGANFSSPVAVTLGAENAQVASVSADLSTITIITPKHSGSVPVTGLVVDVTVTNGSGKSVTRTAGWTWLPVSTAVGAPVIYSVSPNKGSPRGGDTVTILGANLCGSVNSTTGQCSSSPVVTFTFTTSPYTDTRSAQVVSVSPDGKTLVILTPQVSPNPVLIDVMASITVTTNNAGGNTVTLANAFTFLAESAPPLLYYLQPNVGSCLGGDQVTIFGRYLIPPLRVTFSASSGNDAQYITGSAAADGTSAQIITPAASSCQGDTVSSVTVITQYGTGRDSAPITLASAFTYKGQVYQPQIFSITPNSGPLTGGTRVTITGTGFMYPVQVLFGTLQAQVVSSNFNEVICLSPSITPTQPNTPTTLQVQVINLKGSLPNTSNTLPFYYGQAMFISSIGPSIGPDTGGTVVTIFGQGFVGPVAVSFAGIAAQPLTVSGTEVVARTGGVLQRTCSPFSGPVSVTNIDSNTNATSSGNLWTYAPDQPLITSVTVSGCAGASGSTAPGGQTGCTLTINGSGFEPNMQLSFSNPKITLPENAGGTSTQAAFTLGTSFEGLGIKYNTVACTNGTQNLITPVDVTITDPANKCTNTLSGGLLVQPSDLTCHVSGPLTLTLSPLTASISGGTTFTFTVNFSRPAQASDGNLLHVAVSPSASGVISSATSFNVPVVAGDTFESFNVTAGATAGTATITVSFAGTSATATLTVTSLVTGIIFTPNAVSLAPGGGATIGISINPAAATNTSVTVNLIGPSGVVATAFPQTVTVPAGGTYALPITAGSTPGSVTLQGTALGLNTGSATVTVTTPAVTLSLTPASQTLAPTQGATLNVTITPPPAAPANVTLTLAGPAGVLTAPVFPDVVSVPITGTVAVALTAGTTNGTVTINASYGTATASATVTVQTVPLTLAMAPTTQTLAVGGTANFIVSINVAQPVPVTVFITQNGPNGIISFGAEVTGAPPAVTIPANQTFTNFTVNGLVVGGPVTITGTLPPAYGSGTANSTVTVSNFILTLSPNPMNLGVGATTNMTVTLNNPAPSTTSVGLASANPLIATVPATVTFPAGATTETVVVTGIAPGTTTITAGPVASLGNAQATTTVTVTPYTFTLAPNPMTLLPGATATLTATLNNPAASGHTTQIVIGAVPAGIATLGTNTLIFPPGTTTATTVVTAVGPGTATVTANLQIDAVTVSTSNWTITTLSGLTMTANPSSIAGWQGGLFTVQLTLNAPAPAAITVPLTVTGPGGVISAPASVGFAAGANTAQFVIDALSVSPNGVPNNVVATLPGQYGGGQASVSIIVNLPLTFTPAAGVTLGVGTTANIIVTMAAVQPTGTTVTLTWAGSPSSGAVNINGGPPPTTVIIPAFTTFTTFTLTGVSVGAGSITGTLPPTLPQGLGGATANLPVTVTGLPPFTIALTPNPLAVVAGGTANLTITLNQAAAVTSTVTLSGFNADISVSPTTVNFTAGTTTRTVVVTGVAVGTTQITATGDANLNNAVTSTTVNVTPPYTITLSPNPMTIVLGTATTANLTVTLNQPAPAGGADVTLALGAAGIVTVTSPVHFSAGATTNTALVEGVAPGTTTITANSTAVLNNATTTSTVTVTP